MGTIGQGVMRVALAAGWAAAAGPALAQVDTTQAAPSVAAPGQAGTPGSVQVAPGKPRMRPAPVPRAVPGAPGTTVLGVPVTADAPVSPSYDGTAYKTLGGQAETGEDAIDGQVMQPTGAGPAPK